MPSYDIFNGDADGLCALQQLRLHSPRDAVRVTGTKREVALLERVAAAPGDHLTVLDVSMHANAAGLRRCLAAGAYVEWFDHHHPGEPRQHPNLVTHLDLSPAVCTSLIVDRHLGGAHRAWAVVGAFGDNLDEAARAAAAPLGLDAGRLERLQALGQCLNYNAYGASVEELLFHPAELFARLHGHADPLDFAARDDAFATLATAREQDLQRALRVPAALDAPAACAVILADAPWARRVIGTFSNHLASQEPRRAHAVLVPQAGRFTVSIRAPLAAPTGADRFALEFGGGGRAAAAGVNALAPEDVPSFLAAFRARFG
jgi:hypothetical protein